MRFKVEVIGLRGTESEKTRVVEAGSACEAIRKLYPRREPMRLSETEAWTGGVWGSPSYPYIYAESSEEED